MPREAGISLLASVSAAFSSEPSLALSLAALLQDIGSLAE